MTGNDQQRVREAEALLAVAQEQTSAADRILQHRQLVSCLRWALDQVRTHTTRERELIFLLDELLASVRLLPLDESDPHKQQWSIANRVKFDRAVRRIRRFMENDDV